jgi:hypothetical protein
MEYLDITCKKRRIEKTNEQTHNLDTLTRELTLISRMKTAQLALLSLLSLCVCTLSAPAVHSVSRYSIANISNVIYGQTRRSAQSAEARSASTPPSVTIHANTSNLNSGNTRPPAAGGQPKEWEWVRFLGKTDSIQVWAFALFHILALLQFHSCPTFSSFNARIFFASTISSPPLSLGLLAALHLLAQQIRARRPVPLLLALRR